MPKIAKLIAVTAALFSLLAAQAGAMDLRSPDAVDAALQAQQPQSQDLRSPDATDSANAVEQGQSLPTYTTTQGQPPSSDDDFEWGFVGLGIVAALCIGGTVLAVRQRRRRRSPGQLVGARS